MLMFRLPEGWNHTCLGFLADFGKEGGACTFSERGQFNIKLDILKHP